KHAGPIAGRLNRAQGRFGSRLQLFYCNETSEHYMGYENARCLPCRSAKNGTWKQNAISGAQNGPRSCGHNCFFWRRLLDLKEHQRLSKVEQCHPRSCHHRRRRRHRRVRQAPLSVMSLTHSTHYAPVSLKDAWSISGSADRLMEKSILF